jgi:hypothetical protein
MDSPAHFVKVEKYSQVQWESSSFGVSVCGFWFSCSLHLKLTWLQMYSSCVLCDCHLLDENFFAPLALQCGHVLPKFLPAHNTCLHRGPNQVMKTTKHQARPAIWSSFAVLLWQFDIVCAYSTRRYEKCNTRWDIQQETIDQALQIPR